MQRYQVMVLLGDLPKLLQSILVEPLFRAKNIKLVHVDRPKIANDSAAMDAVVLSENSYNALAASLSNLPLLVVVSMDGAAATAYRHDRPPQIFNDFTHADLIHLVEQTSAHETEHRTGFFKNLWRRRSDETAPMDTLVCEAEPVEPDEISKELGRLAHLIIKHRRPALGGQGPGRALADLATQLAARSGPSPLPLPSLDRIAQRFGLTPAECNLLSLSALVEVDLRAAKLVGLLNDHMQQTRPTVGLIADIGGAASETVARLAPSEPLMRSGLINLEGEGPIATRAVKAHPDVWPVIFGMPRKPPFRLSVANGDGIARLVLSDDQRNEILQKSDIIAKAPGPVRVVIVGDKDVGRAKIAKVIAAKLARNVLSVGQSDVAPDDASRSLNREAVLNEAALIVEDTALIDPKVLRDILDGTDAPVFLLCAPTDLGQLLRDVDRPLIEVDAPKRNLAQRARMWLAAAPEYLNEDELRGTAERFDMGGRQIPAALELARSRNADGDMTIADVRAACETLRETRFEGAAEHLPCPFEETDIVLTKETRTELDLAMSWARHGADVFGCDGPGRALHAGGGMACLFSGPPGVGKTMAAQIIARQVDYALYRIDLSKVVDKFIGESEKKLAALFDEAERSRVALFFDEADAIFGKRTQVKDSHDRYANITVDYLLQRIEGFEGFAILATNLAGNIDEAFLRRVRVRAEFTAPGPEDRLLIWQKLLPPESERSDDIDIERLARPFELVGGEIRNAIYTAHLLARDEAQPLGMAHCVKGLWREIRKIGRVTDPQHLGPWRDVVTG